MTSVEQQALFEQTRARIQRNLNEIAALAQRTIEPREFFARFLHLAVDSLSAQGGAVWTLHASRFERVAEVAFETSGFAASEPQQKAIETVLGQVAQSKQQFVVGAGPADASNATPYPFFYTPVLLGEQLVLVLQVWLKEAGDPQSYRDIAAFLAGMASHAVIFLRNHQGNVATAKNEELGLLLRMQTSLLGELNPKEVASVLANYASDMVRADLGCVFKRKGKRWSLIAASNQEAIDEKSHHSRRLTEWAASLGTDDKAQAGSLETCTDEKRKEAWSEIGYEQAAWKYLKSPEHHAEHMLCTLRHGENAFASNIPVMLDRMGEAAGKALDTAFHYNALPFRPVLTPMARTVDSWRSHRRGKLLFVLLLLVLIGVGMFAVPVPYKITTDCTVEPAFKSFAVAETQGKIVKVFVREGRPVTKGELLAQLSDEDYVTQLAVAEQQRVRWQVEAARAQTAGNEAERKLAEVNSQRETEAIKRLEYLKSKTKIIAPIDGTILTKNLHNREGETLDIGGVFCEVSGMDDYDLVLQIKQNDIGDLLKAMEKEGSLKVDFILHSHAKYHLSAVIDGDEHISQLPEMRKDHSCYLVKIPFPKGSEIEHLLKPGYTGKAKVRLGKSNLFYAWFRGFMNYWRVEWGV